MKTNDLITALSADAPSRPVTLAPSWTLALVASILVAAAVLFATIGPREDIAAAAMTIRFLFKFVVTIALAASAFVVFDRLARPGAFQPGQWLWLAIAPALLALAIGLELWVQPQEQWSMLTTGKNSFVCLVFVPLIGIGPLAIMIMALRHAAPTRPVLGGIVAGIVAGGIAATFYAAHCTDDSPLFVATWYTPAIAGLAIIGGIAGRLISRW